MAVTPLSIVGTGMVTSLGLDTASSCAAIRCSIDNFQETRFMDEGGEWQIGSEVLLAQPWRGYTKLIKMAAMSIAECLDNAGVKSTSDIPLILSLPEKDRPGRVIKDDNEFFSDLEKELGKSFAKGSRVICYGHTAAAVALKHARKMFEEGKVSAVLIAGVDSLLSARALAEYQDQERLLTSQNSNGFVPGEAAACFLVQHQTTGRPVMQVHGLGFAVEEAKINSGLPLKAEGLRTAINASLSETGCQLHELEYRITDMTGEHYYFKEASLALSRTLKKVVPEFDILHPTDCVGETGAAAGHVVFCYQNYFSSKGGGKRILAHFGDTDGKRSAAVLSFRGTS